MKLTLKVDIFLFKFSQSQWNLNRYCKGGILSTKPRMLLVEERKTLAEANRLTWTQSFGLGKPSFMNGGN